MRVFESFLNAYRGAFVLVSHDRAFLDAVATTTWFLRDGRLWCFDLPFSEARAALAEADDAARRSREAEERKIEAVRASAKRLAIWGRDFDNEKFARRAKSMEKRAERMEAEKTFVTEGSPLDLTLDLAAVRSKEVVRVENLRVAPTAAPDHRLFDIDQFLIRPGERVALLGANGVGKSTFIRLLTGAFRGAETAGIRLSPQARLGYYDQELDEATSESSLVDFIIKRVDVPDAQVRRRLINAGFPYRDHDKRLSVMSGGERARALFVLLSLRAPNFLILDEPTNHIDIDGKEQLEEQLLDSGAAVLITSHDRRFLDTVAQRYVLIQGKRLVEVTDPVGVLRFARRRNGAAAIVATRRRTATRASRRCAGPNRRDRVVAGSGPRAKTEVPEAGAATAVARGTGAAVPASRPRLTLQLASCRRARSSPARHCRWRATRATARRSTRRANRRAAPAPERNARRACRANSTTTMHAGHAMRRPRAGLR